VQAISRDLLTAALQRIEATGYPIVLHVHDDVVAEVPESFGSPEEFSRLMTELPPWAAGLPLAAKAERRQRYGKDGSAKPPLTNSAPRITPEEFDEINAGLIREGIEPLTAAPVAEPIISPRRCARQRRLPPAKRRRGKGRPARPK
jgi:hypothetical protein